MMKLEQAVPKSASGEQHNKALLYKSFQNLSASAEQQQRRKLVQAFPKTSSPFPIQQPEKG
jgi:hypothetical protein